MLRSSRPKDVGIRFVGHGPTKAVFGDRGQRIDAEVGTDFHEGAPAILMAIGIERIEHATDHERVPVARREH